MDWNCSVCRGLIIVILGFFGLGSSVSVGLPEEKLLKTGGIYQFSRNPMYLGGFIMCVGSCVYSIHIINFILFAITVAIHHSIVLKEEKFLEKRFGDSWLDTRTKSIVTSVGKIFHKRIKLTDNSFKSFIRYKPH